MTVTASHPVTVTTVTVTASHPVTVTTVTVTASHPVTVATVTVTASHPVTVTTVTVTASHPHQISHPQQTCESSPSNQQDCGCQDTECHRFGLSGAARIGKCLRQYSRQKSPQLARVSDTILLFASALNSSSTAGPSLL